MTVALLCNGRTVRIALERVLEYCATMWIAVVAQGYNRLLFLKTGSMTRHVRRTIRGMLEHGPLMPVLGQVGKEEGDGRGRVMNQVAIVITVGTSTMEHLAGCTCYAARTGLGARHAGTGGNRGSSVATKGLAKETLGSGRRPGLVVGWWI